MKTIIYHKDTFNIEFRKKNKKGDYAVTHTCVDIPYKKHVLTEDKANAMIVELEKGHWECSEGHTKFIGIVGYAGSGKDTFANMCIEILGKDKAIRMAFADNVKLECAKYLAPIMKKPWKEILAEMHDLEKKARYRLIMQWWGTEFRRFEDKDYWVDKMKADVEESESKNYIFITDVRFQNEIDYIKGNGGIVIWVDNGRKSKDKHASEDGELFKQRDIVVCNIATLETLNKLAQQVCDEIKAGKYELQEKKL